MTSTSVVFSGKIDFPKMKVEQTAEELEEKAKELRSARQLPESDDAASNTDGAGSQSSAEETDEMSFLYKASCGDRQIEIDILDSANVKKYEKLVQNDLLKSPFKRRLSGESSSEEADAGRRTSTEMERDDVDDDGEAGAVSQSVKGRAGDSSGQWKKSKRNENDHGSNWRLRRESSSSGTSSQNSRREYETDETILARRQKQIDYGKNTLGYETYIQKVPKNARTKDHPKTPQKHLKYSRRAWDGIIKVWRKKLHSFDPNGDSSSIDEKA